MLKMALVAGAVVGLEIGTVGMTMMISGGPKKIIADVPAAPTTAPAPKEVEVKLVEARLPNSQGGGRLYLYDLQVVTTTEETNKAKVTELFAEKEASIRDRIRTIIARSDPKTFSEPGLETLRRQIAYELEQAVGKDLIKEVLIPKCTPIRGEW
jgi:flagellar basal body-associated protein FliL